MTPSQRARLAAPVVVIYWLMLLGGLTLFTVSRADDLVAVAPLWLGALAGTLLGQYLALHDFRFWIVALVIAVFAMYAGPMLPSGPGTVELWRAFVPAALCGFFSLSDRAVLAAAWFPIVLWMLTILDRNEAGLAPDGAAAVLLGGLVLLFIALLCARESRRVALWRSVAALPIAPARPVQLLREPPGRQLARAAWGLSLGAITIALAVWLAPPLWQTEDLGGDPIELAGSPAEGLPCCPLHRIAGTESSRVREYFDLGLGHDERATSPRDGIDCRVCPEPAVAALVPGADVVDVPADVVVEHMPTLPEVAAVPGVHVAGGRAHVAGTPGASDTVTWPPAGTPIEPSVEPEPASPGATDQGSPIEPTLTPEPPRPDVSEPPAADQALPPEPPPALPSPPPVAAPIAPDPPPSPAAAPASPPPPQTATARPAPPHRTTSHAAGPQLLRWLIFAAIAAAILQLVRLALRPLRRLITLRHLRRPFWDETVDQRVSNAWQLALIGLRDAGWRAGAAEAPQQLAHRTGVDGLGRCATILERARHGVGIDAGDLADMQTAADLVYRAARTGLGGFARAVSWLRWPLT